MYTYLFIPFIEDLACIYTYYIVPGLPLPQWYCPPHSRGRGGVSSLVFARDLAAFLTTRLIFARFLKHLWLPALFWRGRCYLLDDLRSTHTPSKYIRASYRHKSVHMYMWCTHSLSLHIYIYFTYSFHLRMYMYVYIYIFLQIYIYIYHIHV